MQLSLSETEVLPAEAEWWPLGSFCTTRGSFDRSSLVVLYNGRPYSFGSVEPWRGGQETPASNGVSLL